MRAVRVATLRRKAASPRAAYFPRVKLSAAPTTNRNVGNTTSVGVSPFQGACSSGTYDLPGPICMFTTIINATVRPRSTSIARNRLARGGIKQTSRSRGWREELQPDVPLGRCAGLQCDQSRVHLLPLRPERIHEVILFFDGAEAVILGRPQMQGANLR